MRVKLGIAVCALIFAGCLAPEAAIPGLGKSQDIDPASESCNFVLPDGSSTLCDGNRALAGQDVVTPNMNCMFGISNSSLTEYRYYGWWHGPTAPGEKSGPLIQQGFSYKLNGTGPMTGVFTDLTDASRTLYSWPTLERRGFVQVPVDGSRTELEMGGVFYSTPIVHSDQIFDGARVWWQFYPIDDDSWLWGVTPVLELVKDHQSFFAHTDYKDERIGSDHSGSGQMNVLNYFTSEIDTQVLGSNVHATIQAYVYYGWISDSNSPFFSWTCNCPDGLVTEQLEPCLLADR